MGNSKYGLLALAGLDGVGRKALRRARKGGWTAGFSTWHVREIQERLGVTNTIAEQIKGDFSLESGKEKYEWLTKRKIHLLAYNDAEYPAWLREIADPPELLYAMGKLESLSMPAIALVGTRNPTVYGKNIARQFGMELAKRKWAAISGLARGIDGEAHRGAVEANGVTIAVLGCGIDQIYPKENEKLAEKIKDQGLLLSEYAPGTVPQKGFFPERNRIISGLGRGTIVVEAASRSGSLITADFAGDQGRDVFAVPGSIHSPKSAGCHWLIQQGAKLVQNIDDVLSEYPDTVSGTNESINGTESTNASGRATKEESIVLEAIQWEPVSYEEVLCRTSFSSSYLHYILLSLQVKKLIMQLPGPAYVRITP